MYRTGHGDCFLLAFAGENVDKPAYLLIDCGYKPGSPKFINTKVQEIAENIRDATGGRLDVAVITHEHQDHVNGITAANFKGITIGETWLAWTEDPEDDLANRLRRLFKDKLLGLLAAPIAWRLPATREQCSGSMSSWLSSWVETTRPSTLRPRRHCSGRQAATPRYR